MEKFILKLSRHNVRCTTYNLVLVHISPKPPIYATILFKNFDNVLTKKLNNNLLLFCDT